MEQKNVLAIHFAGSGKREVKCCFKENNMSPSSSRLSLEVSWWVRILCRAWLCCPILSFWAIRVWLIFFRSWTNCELCEHFVMFDRFGLSYNQSLNFLEPKRIKTQDRKCKWIFWWGSTAKGARRICKARDNVSLCFLFVVWMGG